jgi:hypothetical protein
MKKKKKIIYFSLTLFQVYQRIERPNKANPNPTHPMGSYLNYIKRRRYSLPTTSSSSIKNYKAVVLARASGLRKSKKWRSHFEA